MDDLASLTEEGGEREGVRRRNTCPFSRIFVVFVRARKRKRESRVIVNTLRG